MGWRPEHIREHIRRSLDLGCAQVGAQVATERLTFVPTGPLYAIELATCDAVLSCVCVWSLWTVESVVTPWAGTRHSRGFD